VVGKAMAKSNAAPLSATAQRLIKHALQRMAKTIRGLVAIPDL